MTIKLKSARVAFQANLALTAFMSVASLTATPAVAGDCPADQVAENAMEHGATMPKGVTDDVISAIDLAPKGDAWKHSRLRMRKLVVQPGGVVPWHSHEARPANILIASGSITEYRSTCKVPILHKKGDVTAEFGQLSHWWKNTGKVPAILYSSDILTDETQQNESM
jgi:quercetin dioxygenase-like cupin family protein